MKIRTIITTTVLILVLITISTTTAAAISCDCGDICANETGWWRDDGVFNASTMPIQAVVDNASSGETIYVAAGSYTENVVIMTPHLTLQGEGADVVTVNAASSSDNVFEVTADYVNISGFNMTGATEHSYVGIYLNVADHCKITENTASNNDDGIYLHYSSNNTLMNNTASSNGHHGIFLLHSSNNTLQDNNASNNDNGIYLWYSSNNMLASNNASNNDDGIGIKMSSSSNNTLMSNNASNNDDGIYLWCSSNNMLLNNNVSNNGYGIFLASSSNNNTLTNNNASNNNCGIYLSSSSNNMLESNNASNNYYGIYLWSLSNYNTLANNNALNNNCGIYLSSSSNYNTLANNNASNNYNGIYLYSSSNYNTLANNNVSNNSYGIYLYASSNNTFTNNNASNNHNGIWLSSSSYNTLANNNASNNNCGIYLYSSSNYNTLANNNASNNYYGIYLDSSSNNNTLANNNASNNGYGIYLWYSSNNMLENNNENSNNYYGIWLSSSSNNTLANNNASSNNYRGIYLYSSSNNTLTENTVSSNGDYGIYLSDSSDNLVYNNYFNNMKNAYDNCSNQWNTTKTNGENIIRGSHLGGNYWSDYAGNDTTGNDGLGDTLTPYNSSDDIKNGGDYLPLVMLDYTPLPGITYLQNITHARTYINWTWTDPVDPEFSKVMVYLDGVFQDNVTIGVQCYNATLLTPGTTYEIGTRTVDTTGDINQIWVNHTATTASTTDTTASVISNIEYTDLTTDSVTISWITYENSDSVIRYGTTSGNYTNEESNTALVTLHNIPLSGLSEETTYYYMVYSTDASGNTGESSECNFTTAAISDNATVVLIGNAIAAPNGYAFTSIIVSNVTDLGSGSITVTFDPLVVHVTNVTSGDGNALVVQDWNVDNTTGSVQIVAQDGTTSHNGNVVLAIVNFHAIGEYPDSTPLAISSSELINYTGYGSIGHSVTNGIFSIIDNEPPVITDAIATSDVILNDNGRPRVPGTNVTVLNATVLDIGSGVANVTIDLSPIGGSDDQVMERIAGTDVWTVATNATDGINLTHELVVTATDGSNNTNTSVIGLTVLLRGDVVRDGDVNSADALYIAKYLVGKEPMPSLLVGDISPAEGDGKITSVDALYLAKYLVGKEAAP